MLLIKMRLPWGWHEKVFLSGVDIFDPDTNTWAVGEARGMPTTKAFVGTSEVNGKIYVVGGRSRLFRPEASVEAFDPRFRPPQSVNPAGQLTTTWGKLKAVR